jgi:hypothetical protein
MTTTNTENECDDAIVQVQVLVRYGTVPGTWYDAEC